MHDGGRTEASDMSPSGKNSHSVSTFIDNSINEWRRRLEAVIKNGGGHTQHCNLA